MLIYTKYRTKKVAMAASCLLRVYIYNIELHTHLSQVNKATVFPQIKNKLNGEKVFLFWFFFLSFSLN